MQQAEREARRNNTQDWLECPPEQRLFGDTWQERERDDVQPRSPAQHGHEQLVNHGAAKG